LQDYLSTEPFPQPIKTQRKLHGGQVAATTTIEEVDLSVVEAQAEEDSAAAHSAAVVQQADGNP
jgi:hypothetical protein